MTGSRRARVGIVAWLLTCPVGQACSPLVYEIAVGMDSEHTRPGDSTGMPPDSTLPDPTHPTDGSMDPIDPSSSTSLDPTSQPPTCGDGTRNGDETDLDCGGAECKPCTPGQSCQGPGDCAFGDCFDNTCQKSQCQGPQDCLPAGPCLAVICTKDGHCEAFPAGDGDPCKDDDPCTSEAVCKAGKCFVNAQMDCSAFDGPCRSGACNPNTGNCAVEWLFEGQPCDDGVGCTFFDTCSQGECTGKQPFGPLLFTDFSVVGGWKVDAPWSLGPAKPSKCSLGPSEDPDDDHSPGANGNLAGAEIGGCLSVDAFSDVCLESPPVDVMFMPGELWLTYWSVLNSAGAPMQSRVDVFDGKDQQWVSLVKFDMFTAEGDWTEHNVELTPFKGPAVRVRFCHASSGASDPVGGWSIDDVSIGAPQCL